MENKNQHNDPSKNSGTESEDLKREAPLLFGISKQEPFEAPEGYFDKFNRELSDKISSGSSSPWYYFLFRKAVYIPTLLVILTGTLFLFKPEPKVDFNFSASVPTNTLTLEQASFASLDDYVETHLLASLNTDEIVDLVGKNEIPDLGIQVKKETPAPTIQHIEEEEMEEYILDNMDDFDMYEIY